MKFNMHLGPSDAPMLSINDQNWPYWLVCAYFSMGWILGRRFANSLPTRYRTQPDSWEHVAIIFGIEGAYVFMGWVATLFYLAIWPLCLIWNRD